MRNIWRFYGGWYDGDPSHLKPAPAAAIAAELADARRRRRDASPTGRASSRRPATSASPAISPSSRRRPRRTTRACTRCAPRCSDARAREEASTMSKGIFSWAEHESTGDSSRMKLEGSQDPRHRRVVGHRRRARADPRRAGRDRRHRRPARGAAARGARRSAAQHAPDSQMWAADLGDLERAEQVALEAWDAFGGLDALVNNAAIPKRTHVTDLTPADVDARHGRRLPLPRPHEPRGVAADARTRVGHDRLRVEHGRPHPDRERGRVQRGEVRDVRMGRSDVPRPRRDRRRRRSSCSPARSRPRSGTSPATSPR